jgi:sirohydrochlorin cobaltochelatase
MTIQNSDRALLLFAHGSSDPGWAAPFRRLQAAVQAREPGRMVELAFLERMDPTFDECVNVLHQRGVREVMVAPIFLALGGHLRRDLPALVSTARERTGMRFRVLPALGEIDALIEAIADWVAEASRD